MVVAVGGRLVEAVGGRPLLVVRCCWSLFVGGKLFIM